MSFLRNPLTGADDGPEDNDPDGFGDGGFAHWPFAIGFGDMPGDGRARDFLDAERNDRQDLYEDGGGA